MRDSYAGPRRGSRIASRACCFSGDDLRVELFDVAHTYLGAQTACSDRARYGVQALQHRPVSAAGFTLEDGRTFLTLWDGQSAMCKDVQAFFVVYVQEAHPTDGWQTDSNVAEGILFRQHQSYEEREAIATTCSLDLHLSMPVLVEEMDNAIDEAYGAAPERLYLVGADGRVAYHGGAGPHFFDFDTWEQAIAASVRA